MKFKVKCESFHKQLQSCQRVIGATTISPILANIHLESHEDGYVTIMATDLEIFYQGRVKAQVETAGAMMVPAKNLFEILSTLPSSAELDVIATEGYLMEISTSGADYSLFGNGPEDFPSLPSIDEINTIEFPLPTFRNMMSKVLYSVSMDETKRELCGVLLQGDGRTFRMVATDGRRLGQAEIEIPAGFDKFNDVIVPAKVMRELHKFQNPDMVLKMTVCRTQVVFTLDDITYTSRLIEGNYPDYNKVVPSEKCCTIKVDTDLLLKNLRGIMPIAREVSFTVKCRFGKDSLEIAALSSKIGKGRRYVDIQNDGEPINISYNARYLQDCLTAINSEYTIFEPVSTVKATRIVPETDPTMEKHVNVLMPVRTA